MLLIYVFVVVCVWLFIVVQTFFPNDCLMMFAHEGFIGFVMDYLMIAVIK